MWRRQFKSSCAGPISSGKPFARGYRIRQSRNRAPLPSPPYIARLRSVNAEVAFTPSGEANVRASCCARFEISQL